MADCTQRQAGGRRQADRLLHHVVIVGRRISVHRRQVDSARALPARGLVRWVDFNANLRARHACSECQCRRRQWQVSLCLLAAQSVAWRLPLGGLHGGHCWTSP